jgi:hypothetical protein
VEIGKWCAFVRKWAKALKLGRWESSWWYLLWLSVLCFVLSSMLPQFRWKHTTRALLELFTQRSEVLTDALLLRLSRK